jgi:hypothetical protein
MGAPNHMSYSYQQQLHSENKSILYRDRKQLQMIRSTFSNVETSESKVSPTFEEQWKVVVKKCWNKKELNATQPSTTLSLTLRDRVLVNSIVITNGSLVLVWIIIATVIALLRD